MSNSEEDRPPIVEQPDSSPGVRVTNRTLEQRIRQQEILAELGVIALQGAALEKLLGEAARLAADGLSAEFSKILEYIPDETSFIVRAGVGWGPDVVGMVRIGADTASPAGFALKTGHPVISNHLEREERFRTPDLLLRYGITRAMNVILQGHGMPFGVLEVDSRSDDDFSEEDIAFLQGAANILGMAIERERFQRGMSAALTRHQVLLKEMSHRVKNSLAIVGSLLRLQGREVGDPALSGYLEEAALRVQAIARVHERLHQSDDIGQLDAGQYIEQLASDVDETVARCDVRVEAERGMMVRTDAAIALGLIVNELLTNVAKYAYEGRPGGRIWVEVARSGSRLELSIRDEGIGLPPGFDLRASKGLGLRIVTSFLDRLGASLDVGRPVKGTEIRISVPLDRSGAPQV